MNFPFPWETKGKPSLPTHPILLAGAPATMAKLGTFFVTVDPAAIRAHSPISRGAMQTVWAPMDAPLLTLTPTMFQSALPF